MRDVRRLIRAGLALSFSFLVGFAAAVVVPLFLRTAGPAPEPTPAQVQVESLAQVQPPAQVQLPAKPALPEPAIWPEAGRVKPPAPEFPKPQGAGDFARPVPGSVTGAYGWRRDPIFSDYRFHPGVDLVGRAGQAVKAAYAGRVSVLARAGRDYGQEPAGWEITLEHPAGWTTRYRFAGQPAVQVGINVLKGQSLGALAADGSLHFALYRDGRPADPSQGR